VSYNIKRFTIGAVVQYDGYRGSGLTAGTWNYGHVLGFSQNSTHETILVIQGDDGQTYKIHPSNVSLDFDGKHKSVC
jgi:hypothetical protein